MPPNKPLGSLPDQWLAQGLTLKAGKTGEILAELETAGAPWHQNGLSRLHFSQVWGHQSSGIDLGCLGLVWFGWWYIYIYVNIDINKYIYIYVNVHPPIKQHGYTASVFFAVGCWTIIHALESGRLFSCWRIVKWATIYWGELWLLRISQLLLWNLD